jgi:hypothetical protein
MVAKTGHTFASSRKQTTRRAFLVRSLTTTLAPLWAAPITDALAASVLHVLRLRIGMTGRPPHDCWHHMTQAAAEACASPPTHHGREVLVGQPVDDGVVPVVAAEHRVPTGGQHLQQASQRSQVSHK